MLVKILIKKERGLNEEFKPVGGKGFWLVGRFIKKPPDTFFLTKRGLIRIDYR